MELASQSLYDIIKKNSYISEQAAHYLFVNILKGIEHVHEKGFSHWDIKLENILLTSDYEVKLIDFGFCTNNFKSSERHVGTSLYNPPEWHYGKTYVNH